MEKVKKSPRSGQNSSTCTGIGQSYTGTGSALFFYFDQYSYSSLRRTLSTLALKEYKEPVSNMESRHWKMSIANCPLGKIGKLTS